LFGGKRTNAQKETEPRCKRRGGGEGGVFESEDQKAKPPVVRRGEPPASNKLLGKKGGKFVERKEKEKYRGRWRWWESANVLVEKSAQNRRVMKEKKGGREMPGAVWGKERKRLGFVPRTERKGKEGV